MIFLQPPDQVYIHLFSGYGHLAPTTSAGQVFFTLYAVIGIPLCAIMLVGIGERLARPYIKFDMVRPVTSFPKIEKMSRMIMFTMLCFIVFTLIPAAIIMQLEEWTYLQSWYFTIVTLTTVGFGDFVPGRILYFFFMIKNLDQS